MITKLPGHAFVPKPPDTNRIGVIEVSWTVFEQLGVSIDVADTQGYLRNTGVFDRMKEALLLPLSYSVLTVFTGPFHRSWLIGIESPDLPTTPEYEEAPRIIPTYTRYDDGRVELTRIDTQRGYSMSVIFEKEEKNDQAE